MRGKAARGADTATSAAHSFRGWVRCDATSMNRKGEAGGPIAGLFAGLRSARLVQERPSSDRGCRRPELGACIRRLGELPSSRGSGSVRRAAIRNHWLPSRPVSLHLAEGRRDSGPVPPRLWRNAKLAVGRRVSSPAGSVRKAAISLPGFAQSAFDLKRYGQPLQAEKRQLGIIGTDLLSLLTAQFTGRTVFLSAKSCPSPRSGRAVSFQSLSTGSSLLILRRSRAGFRMFPSYTCASARFMRGRRSTPAMPIRSTPTRSTSTRLSTNVSWRAD